MLKIERNEAPSGLMIGPYPYFLPLQFKFVLKYLAIKKGSASHEF